MKIAIVLIFLFLNSCVSPKDFYSIKENNRLETVVVDERPFTLIYLKDTKNNLCFVRTGYASGSGFEVIDCKYFDSAK